MKVMQKKIIKMRNAMGEQKSGNEKNKQVALGRGLGNLNQKKASLAHARAGIENKQEHLDVG